MPRLYLDKRGNRITDLPRTTDYPRIDAALRAVKELASDERGIFCERLRDELGICGACGCELDGSMCYGSCYVTPCDE